MMLVILLAAVAASASANDAVALDRRVPISEGGFALAATSCPVGSSEITYQSFQGCCPTTYRNQEIACCPANSNCLSALQTTPYCANTDWVLWNSTTQPAGQGYFCCHDGEKGTDSMTCISNTTGVATASQAARLGRPEPSDVTLLPPTTTTSSAPSTTTSTSTTTTSSTSSTATHASSATILRPHTFGLSSLVGFCAWFGCVILGAILFGLNI